MFSSITSYILMGMLLTILLMAGGGYWYFSYSQREIGQLRENTARLEQAVKTQQQAIQAYEQAHARTNQEVLALQQRLSGAERTRRDLEVRLRRQNLEAEARVRRQDTEAQINETFQAQMRSLEQLSGLTAPSVPPASAQTLVNVPTQSDPQPPPRPPQRRSP
jgi:biopolymer transport protein ExbB/TolQ